MENSDNIKSTNYDSSSYCQHLDTKLHLECFSINKPIEISYELKHTNYEPILSDDIIARLNRIRDNISIPITIQSGPRKKFKWYQINWFRRVAKYIRVGINKIKYPVLRCSPEEMATIIKKLKEREV